MAIPRNARKWGDAMDPGDHLDYSQGWQNRLQDGEQIDPDHFEIIPSAEAVLLGLQVGEAGLRAPRLIMEGRGLKMYFSVSAGAQGDPVFDQGVDMAVKVVLRTTATPYRQYERTAVLRVENQ